MGPHLTPWDPPRAYGRYAAREEKFQSLKHEVRRAIVEQIRPPDQETYVENLRREARDMAIKAGQIAVTPPSNSASTFVQLRRMAIEREPYRLPTEASRTFTPTTGSFGDL